MRSSSDLAREMQKLFPQECKVVKIEVLYEDEVKKYLEGIEEAHKRAAKSKLHFP